MSFRFIVMTCGYVENAAVSALIYQCGFFGNAGYKSAKEAITDLALDLYAKFYDERLSLYENRYSKNIEDCCRKSMIDKGDDKSCSTCGRPLEDKAFDPEEFMEYVSNLHCATTDLYGEAEYAGGRRMKWWPFWHNDFIGAPKEDIIHIPEDAELVILAALMEAKPELKSDEFESLFWDDLKE